ncbi:hypothetical protein G7007_05445 [Pseudomonas entomophila]|uniref:hypothetical protein n=1 Tax=Pseudomonas entomophila TaxID=312306 RepID=UPI0015E40342|nr:hypothetical protein [Pseudomonas entomophila]MBA1192309.1 hypothetical protein [Pseudomonas entomophila]
MTQLKTLFALATFALLAACASPARPHASIDWDMPTMQLGGDRGLPLEPRTDRCRKGGCDNHKLFFNPASTR